LNVKSEELKLNVISVARKTNVIFSEIPSRFDLPFKFRTVVKQWNGQIRTKLRNSAAQILSQSSFMRSDFTKHGLHYSFQGKKKLAVEIRT
jgi:hypothetical protein